MTLNDAINRRVSVRKFKELPMQANELANFIRGIEAIPNLFAQIPSSEGVSSKSNLTFEVLTYNDASAKFANLAKVCDYAPYYLFFYGDESSVNYLSCGYIGQIASLWLTCNNFAACFQRVSQLVPSPESPNIYENAEKIVAAETQSAVTTKATTAVTEETAAATELMEESTETSLASEAATANETEEVNKTVKKHLQIVLAFGYAESVKSVCKKQAASKKYISGSPTASLNLELLLQTSCQAPSEYNSQPWRFWTNENTVHIFAQPNILFRSEWHSFADNVACGALLANLATLAELKNLPYQIFCEEQAFAEIEKLTYQLSFRLL